MKGATIRKLEKGVFSPRKEGKCEEVTKIPTREEFFRNYVSASRPVIFKGAAAKWAASSKWTNEYLKEEAGDRQVHVKITPDGEFEGCDAASNWEDHATRVLPERVSSKLSFPDLVVVRPAPHDLPFDEFMHIIETRRDINAYMEYASLSSYLPSLAEDVEVPPFARNLLAQAHFNIWLGNGRTLGKLHFDPFDNLLAQVAGEKHFTIFPPSQSQNLYEGHIPEAQFDFDFETGEFKKKTLFESTSMVMSPVDLKKPNFERFPLFYEATPLQCRVAQGDVIFLPSFWWHEVQSVPDAASRNIAVNYWFDPFFTKDFPCAACHLKVSEKYYGLLDLLEAAVPKDTEEPVPIIPQEVVDAEKTPKVSKEDAPVVNKPKEEPVAKEETIGKEKSKGTKPAEKGEKASKDSKGGKDSKGVKEKQKEKGKDKDKAPRVSDEL